MLPKSDKIPAPPPLLSFSVFLFLFALSKPHTKECDEEEDGDDDDEDFCPRHLSPDCISGRVQMLIIPLSSTDDTGEATTPHLPPLVNHNTSKTK